MRNIAGQLSKVLEPGDQRHCKAKIFTSRHIETPRGPTGEDGRAILENAGKGKEALNWNPSCPKEIDCFAMCLESDKKFCPYVINT